MALHVSEMGIQIKVGEQPSQASSGACEPDSDEAKQRQQDQVVTDTVRRVLEILKAKGAR